MHPFASAGKRTELRFDACKSAPLALLLLLSLLQEGALLIFGIWTKVLGVNGQEGLGRVSVRETEAVRGKGMKYFSSDPNRVCQTQPPLLICQLLTENKRPDPVLLCTWAHPLHWFE